MDGIVGKETWALLQKYSTPTQGGPVTATPQVREHMVQKGDTLFLIGRQYNVSVDEIKKANPGIDPTIPVGRKLNIPNARGTVTPTPQVREYTSSIVLSQFN